MVVAFRREVSTAARRSRNLDGVRVIRCRDVERMMNLTARATEQVTIELDRFV